MAHGHFVRNGKPEDMIKGLRRNKRVFAYYALAGAIALLGIASGAMALAYDHSGWLNVAKTVLGLGFAGHFILFTFEIGTSILQTSRLINAINDREK